MVFRGSDALNAGRVSPYELRARYQRVFPDVYARRDRELSLRDRAAGALSWSGGSGVVTGVAASGLHGAEWVAPGVVIEMSHPNNRVPRGVLTRFERLADVDVMQIDGIPVTTVERTAFDLARRLPIVDAVQRLDALARATHFKVDDVLALSGRYPGVRGCRRVPEVLELVDEGGHSPQESWLRLVFTANGFPSPATQFPVLGPDGYPRYYLDMAWPELMVAAEYDGEQHRERREIYVNDLQRAEYIDRLGWRRLRAVAGDRPAGLCRRIEAAGLRMTCEPPAILRRVRRLGTC